VLGDDDAFGAEGRGGAQDRPDILRVADLVEHHQHRARRQLRAAQHIIEVRRIERIDLERQTLMHRVVRDERRKALAIEDADRLAVAAPCRACRRDERFGLVLLSRQHREPPPGSLGVGERRGDGMAAVKPAPTLFPWTRRSVIASLRAQ